MENNFERLSYKNNDLVITNNTTINNTTKYVIVLAGGIKENGEVNDFVKKRLDKAIEIYNLNKKNNILTPIICLGGGTYHKPPYMNIDKFVVHESSACAKYLCSMGIPSNHIMREWYSYDTIANAYFGFINFIIPLDIKEITVITSEFHMERAKTIFNYINIITNQNINISYLETENFNMIRDVLNIRIKREQNSINNFNKYIIPKYKTLNDFTVWLYTEHNAYKSIIKYINNNKINKSY